MFTTEPYNDPQEATAAEDLGGISEQTSGSMVAKPTSMFSSSDLICRREINKENWEWLPLGGEEFNKRWKEDMDTKVKETGTEEE